MRLRELGITVGRFATGQQNAITDVPGVQVGHASWQIDQPTVQRTGVTVIFPRDDVYQKPCYAATDVLNGFGEMTGRTTIDEWGVLASPIVLTNTRSVGQGYEAVFEHFFQTPGNRTADNSIPLPVVAECDDSFLNDNRQATPPHVFLEAWSSAGGGMVKEGAVGAGTGMHLFGYKGGIGTASRRIAIEDAIYTIGVLVNTNFGRSEQIRLVAGLDAKRPGQDIRKDGSCIGVLATDAPVWPHELKRLARRMGLGLGRTGSVGNDTSGELFLAFSTARPDHYAELVQGHGMFTGQFGEDGSSISDLFEAVVEATEEAVWNALLQAHTVTGVHGHRLEGFWS
ncbi:MAG: peptidase [Sulfobacillus acidophilus]|uniref:Peptidase n=1 Tax=Sulfobacillus acidophilus TaxID=53633 RepID=A0A2T2WNR8_9FIRM|nr:MAG: peptidase [Sulfobacillus acidophilus]